jgi:hypothetical protein
MGNWHSKKSNVGTTINNDGICRQRINYGKYIGQFAFNVSAACFDQGLGLKQTSSSHNKLAVHTV